MPSLELHRAREEMNHNVSSNEFDSGPTNRIIQWVTYWWAPAPRHSLPVELEWLSPRIRCRSLNETYEAVPCEVMKAGQSCGNESKCPRFGYMRRRFGRIAEKRCHDFLG